MCSSLVLHTFFLAFVFFSNIPIFVVSGIHVLQYKERNMAEYKYWYIDLVSWYCLYVFY